MANQPQDMKFEELGKAFAERFKNMPKDTNFAETIFDTIDEILSTSSIEIPEMVKAKIHEYQLKSQGSK